MLKHNCLESEYHKKSNYKKIIIISYLIYILFIFIFNLYLIYNY